MQEQGSEKPVDFDLKGKSVVVDGTQAENPFLELVRCSANFIN